MAGDSEDPADGAGKPEKPKKPKKSGKGDQTCVYKDCAVKVGLKKSKSGNLYCAHHHPDTKKKALNGAKRGGKIRAAQEKAEAAGKPGPETVNLEIEQNKASIIRALVQQANFLGKDLGRKEIKRHRLFLELADRIYEYATEEGDDAQKEAKIAAIVASELPDSIKLSKLVDIVGPVRAMELVKVKIERTGHPEGTLLDGMQLLKEAGKDGKETITKPPHIHVEESDDTSDVPDVAIPTEGSPMPGLTNLEKDAAAAAAEAKPPAPPPAPAPTRSPEELDAERIHQSKELMGLYRAKVRGGFTPHDEVEALFLKALRDGLPFRMLQQRVLFPKSDTDQPTMMIKDVMDAMSRKESA